MNFINKVFSKDYSQERIKPFSEVINTLEYPDCAMYELLKDTVLKFPKLPAVYYYGKEISFQTYYKKILQVARSLKEIGVKKGDTVTISMPNTPEALYTIYAVNMIGAVANMIHPLSSENEIEYYVETAKSKYFVTIDKLKNRVLRATSNNPLKQIIIADPEISMPRPLKTLYSASEVIKNRKVPKTADYDEKNVIYWKDFYYLGYGYNKKEVIEEVKGEDLAVILYSGGTTGKPKGVMLSNNNFNTLALQCISRIESATPGNSVLTILPLFHGFGLGCCVHGAMVAGLKCILVPKFEAKDFSKLIKTTKPSFVIGVPTLFEALINSKEKSKTYLSSVNDFICGGDTLKVDLRNKLNIYLSEHGSKAQVRVGYGLSETVAACIICPNFYYKEGAIGLPLPNMNVKIVKIGTKKSLKPNKVGEICISGPSTMMGYLNEEDDTKETLKKHVDGKMWVHTGDLGYINKDGIIFFESRLKRMIITSGYNVYPTYIEQIIATHPAVESCIVVGVPHPYRVEVPIANVVLHENYEPSQELTNDILEYAKKSIAKYSMPTNIEYLKVIPKTLMGKVNFKKITEDCVKKYGKEE